MNKNTLQYPALLTLLLLGACSDGTVSGGGAGDTEDDQVAVALIEPLVGLYELPINWNGVPTSEAYLEIMPPNTLGESQTLLYEFNAMRNCVEPARDSGEAAKDPFSDRIFFDSFVIGDAILSLNNANLTISLTADINDIDNDGDTTEPSTLLATPVISIASASDLGETC